MHWKKIIGWTFAVLGLLLVVAVAAGYLFLQTNTFHRLAIRKIEDQAYQSTGARAQIGSLKLDLSTLTVHLYNIVLHGTEPSTAPPLLRIRQLTVGVEFHPLLHREIHLSELLIDRPLASLLVNDAGSSNLPQPPPNQKTSHTNVFNLAIAHFSLANGEVRYADKKTPLDANLYDLHSNVTFDSAASRYSGTISYDNGQLRYAQYAPLPHSFSARFSVTPSLFALKAATLKVAGSTASLNAEVINFSDPLVNAHYDIRLHTQDFAALSRSVQPAGDISTTGQIHYQKNGNQPLLRCIAVTGEIFSDGLSAASTSANLRIDRLRADYHLADGTLRVQKLSVDTLGGLITADLDVRNLDRTPVSHLNAALRGISLLALQHSLREKQVSQISLAGTLNGSAKASWSGSLHNLRARSDLNVRGTAKEQGNPSTNVPVNAAVHAAYNAVSDAVTIRQTSIHIPSMTLTANGEISSRASLQIQAQASDLHQLIALASSFEKNPSATPPLSGSASLNATVRGSIHNPQLSGQLTAQNVSYEGSDWNSAALNFAASSSQVSITSGSLINANHGRASFEARVALRNWKYPPSNRIHARLAVQQMPVTDLQHLANVSYPVSGNLFAKVSLDGSELNPAGSGTANIANAVAYNQPLQNLTLKFQAANGSINSTLNLAATAGSAQTTLAYTPKTKAYKINFDAPSITLQKLQLLQQKNLPLQGTLFASASGQGTVENPQLTASIQIPKLELRGKSVDNLRADLNVANKRATLSVNTEAEKTFLRTRVQVGLTGDYPANASIDTSSIPLGAILASLSTSVPEGLQGQTELHATLHGPLKDPARLEAHITIPTLNASYQQLQIAAAAPIRADYANRVLTLQPADIRGTDTSLHIQGSYPFGGTATPTLTADGKVDVRIARIFDPNLHTSGIVTMNVQVSGSPKSPSIHGQVQLQNVNAITVGAPMGVEKLNGTLHLVNDRLEISTMTAQVGGGQVSLGGAIIYRPKLRFTLAMTGKDVRLRYPEGLRTVLDSSLAYSGTLQSSTLSGRVLIDSLTFTPAFDLTSFGNQFGGNATIPSGPGFEDTVKVAVSLQSKESLSATSSQVTIEGSVDLNVIGTLANPVITGRTDLTSGEVFYRGNRYQLQRGVISFANPTQTTPDLNVSVSTVVEQYSLTINLRGPLDRLTSSYVSDPPLATADIIHLIAFGNTTAEASAATSSESTDAMVASSVLGTGLTSGIQKLAGFSSLQIDPLLGGSNQDPTARIALQQRVTKNFLFTFSTDVAQPGQELIQGDYQVNKRWSVNVTRDEVGGISVNGRYHTHF